MQEALESLFSEIVFGPELQLQDTARVECVLGGLNVSHTERALLRAELPRLSLYRKMVVSTLRDAIELAIPRTAARLGIVLDEYLARFLRERGPRTHYLRDVTLEFLEFSEPLWRGDARVPAFMGDLARHESLRIEVAAAVHSPPPATAQALDLEHPVRFTESCRLMRYQYAVHRLSAQLGDRSQPTAEPTSLLVYRDWEHEVRYLELSPVAAGILERLLGRETLRMALAAASLEHGLSLDEPGLVATAELLADLAERGALLGPLGEVP